jgi:hypothetical protein
MEVKYGKYASSVRGCVNSRNRQLSAHFLCAARARAFMMPPGSINVTLSPAAVSFWNSDAPVDLEALRPSAMIASLAQSGIDLVVVQALNDNVTLSRLGAWPPPSQEQQQQQQQQQQSHHQNGSTWETYVAAIANETSALLEVRRTRPVRSPVAERGLCCFSCPAGSHVRGAG